VTLLCQWCYRWSFNGLDFKDPQRRSHEERQPCAHVVAALQLLGTYYGLKIQHHVGDRSIVTTACCNLAWASIYTGRRPQLWPWGPIRCTALPNATDLPVDQGASLLTAGFQTSW
jgi:hypothetical protein